MKNWEERIAAFGRPANKNICVSIQNTTNEELESVIDAIAKDTRWTYKEVKTKNGNIMISYQTTSLGQFSLSGFQVIEFIFIPEENGIRLDIESRYFATKNTYALSFFAPSSIWSFYDPFGKNQENIELILSGLRMYYKDSLTIRELQQENIRQETHKNLSISSFYMSLKKISVLAIYLVFLIGIIYMIITHFINNFLK